MKNNKILLVFIVLFVCSCAGSNDGSILLDGKWFDPEGAFNHGLLHWYGRGKELNYKKACDYFESSANNGYPAAYKNLANCYYFSKGRTRNLSKAIELYNVAANKSVAGARDLLGEIYLFEFNGKFSSRGVNLLNKSMEAGSADAMFLLGVAYYQGIGVEANKEKALSLFLVAYDEWHPLAFALMYIYLSEGLYGFEKNLSMAMEVKKVLEKMVDYETNTFWLLEELLAKLYKNGWGVKKDNSIYLDYVKLAKKRKKINIESIFMRER